MMDAGIRRLRTFALAAHCGLLLAVIGTLAILDGVSWLRVALAGVAVLPLIATLPGLARISSATLPWLALALVAYTGLGTVEVIATGARPATALLLLALAELALVLMLNRRLRSRAAAGAKAR